MVGRLASHKGDHLLEAGRGPPSSPSASADALLVSAAHSQPRQVHSRMTPNKSTCHKHVKGKSFQCGPFQTPHDPAPLGPKVAESDPMNLGESEAAAVLSGAVPWRPEAYSTYAHQLWPQEAVSSQHDTFEPHDTPSLQNARRWPPLQRGRRRVKHRRRSTPDALHTATRHRIALVPMASSRSTQSGKMCRACIHEILWPSEGATAR